MLLIPVIGVTALYRDFANACWDNTACTTGATFRDGLLMIGLAGLIVAAVVALAITPLVVIIVRRSK